MNKSDSTTSPLVPLVIDLDGTLISTDLLYETVNSHILKQPRGLLRVIRGFRRGRTRLKSELALAEGIDAEFLPYNPFVISLIQRERGQGRVIVLATASHEFLAGQVADFLGLFDTVLASTDLVNLKGNLKSQVLVDLYGVNGFDYVGNSKADLPVWKMSRQAYIVSSNRSLIQKARASGDVHEVQSAEGGHRVTTINGMLRFHQWVKNLLVFIPLLATHQILNPASVAASLGAFLSFGLAASAIYIVNDLVDISSDRRHPTKRNRSLASGRVSLLAGWITWPILLVLAFAVSVIFLNVNFVMVLLAYIVLTLSYSLKLKQTAILDVVALAALYTLRILAGAAAISTPPSFWILTFSMFFFLSLALMKRFSELRDVRLKGADVAVHGRGYVHHDLELVSSLGASSGLIAVLVFMLYVEGPKIVALYSSPALLWLAGPLLLMWVARAWLIAHRGEMHVDPIIFAIRDKVSYVIAALIGTVFVLAWLL